MGKTMGYRLPESRIIRSAFGEIEYIPTKELHLKVDDVDLLFRFEHSVKGSKGILMIFIPNDFHGIDVVGGRAESRLHPEDEYADICIGSRLVAKRLIYRLEEQSAIFSRILKIEPKEVYHFVRSIIPVNINELPHIPAGIMEECVGEPILRGIEVEHEVIGGSS